MSAELVALIERDRLCLYCLARRMQRRTDEVALALADFARTLRLSSQAAICAGCASVRMTYKIS